MTKLKVSASKGRAGSEMRRSRALGKEGLRGECHSAAVAVPLRGSQSPWPRNSADTFVSTAKTSRKQRVHW